MHHFGHILLRESVVDQALIHVLAPSLHRPTQALVLADSVDEGLLGSFEDLLKEFLSFGNLDLSLKLGQVSD